MGAPVRPCPSMAVSDSDSESVIDGRRSAGLSEHCSVAAVASGTQPVPKAPPNGGAKPPTPAPSCYCTPALAHRARVANGGACRAPAGPPNAGASAEKVPPAGVGREAAGVTPANFKLVAP